jgi:hypothetical protein
MLMVCDIKEMYTGMQHAACMEAVHMLVEECRYRYIYRLQNSVGIKGPCDWGGTQSLVPIDCACKTICQATSCRNT